MEAVSTPAPTKVPPLGTAAAKDAGTAAGNVLLINADGNAPLLMAILADAGSTPPTPPAGTCALFYDSTTSGGSLRIIFDTGVTLTISSKPA